MKTYILQKDLPNLNAGSELTLSCDRERYEIDKDNTGYYFSMYKKVVENTPEWFKLKEMEIPEGLAIDVSGGVKEEIDELIRLWLKYKPKVIEGSRKYTLQDMKDCYNISRGIGTYYESFSSFIIALNQTK